MSGSLPPRRRISRRNVLIGGVVAAVGAASLRRNASSSTGTPAAGFAPGGSWGELISLGDAAPVHVSMLVSGRVLITGTRDREYTPQAMVNAVLDPPVSHRIDVRSMGVPVRRPSDTLFCSGHTFLPDGRLLYVGGSRSHPESGLAYAILFDPAGAGAWQRIHADLRGGPAWYPTVTRLDTGSMLVISGFSDWGETQNRSIQLLDPADLDRGDGPWNLVIPADQVPDVSPNGADYTHTFVLPRPPSVEGRLRQVAMLGKSGLVHLFTSSDPFTNDRHRFIARPNGRRPSSPRNATPAAGASSVLLSDGRILIIGAGTEDGLGDPVLAQQAHIYDPGVDRWRTVETDIARAHPAAVMLPDGRVLVVNGDGGIRGDPRRPQIIDPESEVVITGPPWPDEAHRGYHNVALLLPDGRVLTAGGQTDARRNLSGPLERPDLRYYLPPYLSALVEDDRPRIVTASPIMRYADQYPIRFVGGPIHRVSIVGLGSMTHSFDQNQRCIILWNGESEAEGVNVLGPADGSVAPPGAYMLFILRRIVVQGDTVLIPSIARVVKLA
jgi:galactose oxidase